MDEEHFRKLERMYHGAPINDVYDAELAVREGEAELVIPVREGLFHPAGGVHGSAYFKALDDAAFFAANSLVADVFLLTTDFSIYLTRPVSEGEMRAVGELVNDNPRQLIAQATLYDEEGRQLAWGGGSFDRSRVELTPEIGYE